MITKDLTIDLGNDTAYTFNDMVITEFTMSHQNNVDTIGTLGSREVNYAVGVSEIRGELHFVCRSVSHFAIGKYKEKIRDKKVDDCTIEELLLAVRAKTTNMT